MNLRKLLTFTFSTLLIVSSAHAENLKICQNKNGQLVAKKRCAKSEKIAQITTGQQGQPGSNGKDAILATDGVSRLGTITQIKKCGENTEIASMAIVISEPSVLRIDASFQTQQLYTGIAATPVLDSVKDLNFIAGQGVAQLFDSTGKEVSAKVTRSTFANLGFNAFGSTLYTHLHGMMFSLTSSSSLSQDDYKPLVLQPGAYSLKLSHWYALASANSCNSANGATLAEVKSEELSYQLIRAK